MFSISWFPFWWADKINGEAVKNQLTEIAFGRSHQFRLYAFNSIQFCLLLKIFLFVPFHVHLQHVPFKMCSSICFVRLSLIDYYTRHVGPCTLTNSLWKIVKVLNSDEKQTKYGTTRERSTCVETERSHRMTKARKSSIHVDKCELNFASMRQQEIFNWNILAPKRLLTPHNWRRKKHLSLRSEYTACACACAGVRIRKFTITLSWVASSTIYKYKYQPICVL